MIEFIEQEELGNGCLQSALVMKQKEHKMLMDKSSKAIQGEQVLQDLAQKKNADVILKIIKIND